MSNARERQHWSDVRRRKEPSLYDEWLAEEKANKAAQRQALAHAQAQAQAQHAQVQASLGLGDTAPAGQLGGTIRAVTPDEAAEQEDVAGRGTSSFERAFIPTTTTTIVGGRAAATSSPTGSSLSNRLRRDRDWDMPGSSRNSPATANGRGMLARSSSRSNGDHAHSHTVSSAREPAYNSAARPRTRTLDERRTRDRSPTTLRHRHRIGSVNTPTSPLQSGGADYLASVPAATSPPSAPSISSLGSPVQAPTEAAPGRRSISPMSSHTADSIPGALPSANTRRILHLMKTLNGRMSGNAIFRRGHGSPWSQSYCFIQEDSGSLLYEPRGGEGVHKTLIPDLRGSKITLEMDGEAPLINVSLPHSIVEVHMKLFNQADFDSWYAALLCWQPLEPRGLRNAKPHPQPAAAASHVRSPEPPPRVTSQRSASAEGSDNRSRANSDRNNRRKSVLLSSSKEAPVIKIGKMVFWDTNVTYNNTPSSQLGQPATGRPQAYRVQSFGSRRWRRISGQLRENGELKLHSDNDNTLISVVQLSQLSRCAIQRLDPTVLDNEYCIAIYPQYTSSPSSNVNLLRPIFLSLESRVLYEVWFVLLRAFTIPALYGPRPDSAEEAETPDVENMLSNSTNDMFRMERSLHIRVVEAKMYPPTGTNAPEAGFSGGAARGSTAPRPEQYGYHVEVLLDNETRGKTVVKYEGLNPLWGETFEFMDLPPVLNSASVVIKRRPPDHARTQETQQSKLVHEAYGFSGGSEGGYSGITFDVTCGKVEIYLEELAAASEIEKWWPVVNMYNQRVGEILIKARAEEGVILMSRDYKPLSDLLHRLSNGLTLQIAQILSNDLKRLSDCLLNIFQVSGKASDWIMALVEDEIDSIHKETPGHRLRYDRGRLGSNDDSSSSSSAHPDRELIVRDLNKNATLEANLLFRGNTLLTKSLDTHMRRIGREYLEEALGARIREINDKDPDCEVDPNRVGSDLEVQRNWRRLNAFTQEIWKGIVGSKQKCPIELRRIFRHVRACAEDRYGDFLRSVSYSSVSGFLFLRFFCPAVLNPKLFGLMKDDMKPKARRTCTLIAKSLQTLANMASFGTKEHWMEPMNNFLTQHRESFKTFIDDVCYVPTPLSPSEVSAASPTSPTQGFIGASVETHLSYTTPMTIMHRLPPTSREGFPSLPYLIDQARNFAELVQMWLESTSQYSEQHEITTGGRARTSLLTEIQQSPDLRSFHDVCSLLHARTQECLNRAERAERPNSALSFRWDELIDQLEKPAEDDASSFEKVANRIASDPTIAPPGHLEGLVSQLQPAADIETDEDEAATRMYESTPPHSSIATFDMTPSQQTSEVHSATHSSIRGSMRQDRRAENRRTQIVQPGRMSTDSHNASASASASNVSSAVSSDTEHTGTTALPAYELHHVEITAGNQRTGSVGFLQQRTDRKLREKAEKGEKEKRRKGTILPAFNKKKKDKSQHGYENGLPSPQS